MEQTLGAIYLGEQRCRFRVWAPDRPGMEVQLVSQGDRRVPMTRGFHGYHEATLDGIAPARGLAASVTIGARLLQARDRKRRRLHPRFL